MNDPIEKTCEWCGEEFMDDPENTYYRDYCLCIECEVIREQYNGDVTGFCSLECQMTGKCDESC